ncbi:hypothetical protein C350_03158 [Cryptococcus neoformans MW-RSA36]|nr:hypothetical protein C350_03158 [Cryptococcus neoformans var. grubii MW-RSA36]
MRAVLDHLGPRERLPNIGFGWTIHDSMTVTSNTNEHGELCREAHTTNKIVTEKEEQLVLNTIRCLAADLCQQYKGGHPGTVMGASAIGIALWRYEMRYNPLNPDWFNRDRIEVTTGPLGQGISNAVGMAIASKQLAATYNREGLDIVDNKIWCFTGDGCLQEGVGQEAISLAGHLGLDNLILIYDNNAVTVDGRIDNCFTENTSKKLQAQGWNVIDVYDGSNDVSVKRLS